MGASMQGNGGGNEMLRIPELRVGCLPTAHPVERRCLGT